MDDLISRQAAVDVLDVLCQEHRYKIPGKRETYSQYNEAWQDALDRAEGAIFNLPSAQPEQRWIPVSERLPEIDEDGYSSYVLVSFSNFTLPFIGQLRKTDGENHWYEGDDEEALDSFGLHVNAWMPLPEPYREERTEE